LGNIFQINSLEYLITDNLAKNPRLGVVRITNRASEGWESWRCVMSGK